MERFQAFYCHLRVTWGNLSASLRDLALQLGFHCGALLGWLAHWWRDREGRRLLAGLPAGIVGVAAVVLFVTACLQSSAEVVSQYADAAEKTLRGGDHATARLMYERLTTVSAAPQYQYGLAYAEFELGHRQRAAALMGPLAPADRQGYAQAHLWVAKRLLTPAKKLPGADKFAELHLRRAVQTLPDNGEAQYLLGMVLLLSGRPDQAEQHLAKAASTVALANLFLAKLYFDRKNERLGREYGERAELLLRHACERNVDDQEARVRWAEAAVVLRDFSRAVTILKEGYDLIGGERYRTALMQSYIAWSDALAADPKGDLASRIAHLEKALVYVPSSAAAQQRLLAIVRAKEGADTGEVRAALERMLAQGTCRATAHLLLGLEAQGRGQAKEAREHFEQAYRQAPHMPMVLNNLAGTVANADKPDLPRALELVESALKAWPGHPGIRHTRGCILTKMGRWKDALPDLEAALPKLRNDAELRALLAETYEQLGMSALAAEHRRLAAEGQPR